MAEMFWRHGDDYSFKQHPLNFQYMAFCLLKDGLLLYKRTLLANAQEASVNRKKKPLKCNKPKVFAVKRRK